MEPFTRVESVAAVVAIPNLDTDRIVPARYLHNPRSAGYGQFLLHDLRFQHDGQERPDFVLNLPTHRNARILVGDANFGCGSSREAAVWALYGFGIRVVIALGFGDIFFENCFKNGLLPVVLPEPDLQRLRAGIAAQPLAPVRVDLERQRIEVAGCEPFDFTIEPFRREVLLLGLDDIGITLQHAVSIDAFEKERAVRFPWL